MCLSAMTNDPAFNRPSINTYFSVGYGHLKDRIHFVLNSYYTALILIILEVALDK